MDKVDTHTLLSLPKMSAMAGAAQDGSWEPGTQSTSPTWEAGTQPRVLAHCLPGSA